MAKMQGRGANRKRAGVVRTFQFVGGMNRRYHAIVTILMVVFLIALFILLAVGVITTTFGETPRFTHFQDNFLRKLHK
jgi:hypothetical protein